MIRWLSTRFWTPIDLFFIILVAESVEHGQWLYGLILFVAGVSCSVWVEEHARRSRRPKPQEQAR